MDTVAITPGPERLAPGISPESPPTHIEIRFDVPGTPVEGSVTFPLEPDSADRHVWLDTDELVVQNSHVDMLSGDLPDDYIDAVVAALDEAGIPTSVEWLSVGVTVLAWRTADDKVLIDHVYSGDGYVYIVDLPCVSSWSYSRPLHP